MRRRRQQGAVDLEHGHVDLAALILALPPHGQAAAVQVERHGGGPGQVIRVNVKRDLDAVGQVRRRLIEQHMPARHQVQVLVPLEEEAAGSGEQTRAEEGGNARGG